VKDLHRDELDEKLDKIERFKDTTAVNELQQLYSEGVERVEPGEMTGTVKGRYNVFKHAGNAFSNAESEIKIMTTEEGLNDVHENHLEDLQAARDNGVNVRVLAPVSDNNRDAFEEISGVAEVRHLHDDMGERPEARFHIVDDENVVISLTDDDTHPTQDTAFWSRSEHAARDALGPMFEMAWQSSGRPPE